jgi:hypothetical protein
MMSISAYSAALDSKLSPAISHEPWTIMVKMSKCHIVKMSKCQNVKMSKCQNVKMSKSQKVKKSKNQNV